MVIIRPEKGKISKGTVLSGAAFRKIAPSDPNEDADKYELNERPPLNEEPTG